MPSKTATEAATAAVSEQPANETQAGSASTALAPTGDQAVATQESVVSLGLSEAERAMLSLRLQKALHAIEMGFDALTKPTDIMQAGQPFFVVDGKIIEDFVDKKTGEEKSKVVFVLEFSDGRVVNTMQGAAAPRKVIAEACEIARALGGRFKAGPYKFIKKGVGQLQDAIIFEQQPGWKQEVY